VAQFTTLTLLVFHLTGSAIGVSGAVIAEIAPVLLLAPLAGPMVDRLPRVRVMIGADVVRLVLAGVLAVWHTQLGVVYAVTFGLSAGGVFFNPAASSLLPALVSDAELVAANGGIWSAAVLSQIALAPVAGLMVAVSGYTAAFAINAASFAASALLLRGLNVTEDPATVAADNLYRKSNSGWCRSRCPLPQLGRRQRCRHRARSSALRAAAAGQGMPRHQW
ncbi:MAG: MFS transporter, partial [Acidimicrobiales bacterium]